MNLNFFDKILFLHYKYHLILAFVVRICFILYGTYHDNNATVPYTDIDYSVFTDASRHILINKSPYDRHTYRYTPLLALLLTPNVFLHHAFGKILFCIFDLLVAILIRAIVKRNVLNYEYMKKEDINEIKDLDICIQQRNLKNSNSNIQNICMLLWLYNPMSIAISTRGNCDSLATLLVLLTLYYLQCKNMYFLSGLIHGLSTYVRLYPLFYSLAIYVYLSNLSSYSTKYSYSRKNIAVLNENMKENKSLLKSYLVKLLPNSRQVKFILGFIISLVTTISISYHFYGYKFLYETYLYHLIRKDVRHNFSLYFYLQYLSVSIRFESFWQKLLMTLPQLVLLISFSIKYGLNKFALNFSILTQTIVLVAFNSVLTSQYFIWILGILPLCTWQIKMPYKTVLTSICIWVIAQIMWLLPAYYLEFKGQNTFLFIWIQCISFYCANIAILGRLIKHFMFV